MAMHDNAYSRVVFWLKIVLPLTALAILSTMFLVARTIDPTQAIPFSKVDVRQLARNSQMSAPTYSGVMDDGTSVIMTADKVQPDHAVPGRALATTVSATFLSPDGSQTDLTASSGVIDHAAGRLSLDGNVTLSTPTGYEVSSDRMISTLDKSRIDASGDVNATGPIGRITSDTASLDKDPAVPGSHVLVFKGGVKLVYEP